MAYPTVFAGLTPPATDLDIIDVPLPVLTSAGSTVTFLDPLLLGNTDGTYDCLGNQYEFFQVILYDQSTGDWHVQSGANGYRVYVGGTIRGPYQVSATQAAAVAAWQVLGFTTITVPVYNSPTPLGNVVAQRDINDVDIPINTLMVAGATVRLLVSAQAVVPIGVGSTPVRGNQFVTAQDLIVGALRRINIYAPGESLAADDSSDALESLNELLESWSTDQASVYASEETILTFVPGQYRYTIGNYDAGTFAGQVTYGSPTITNVTPPADMVVGGDLSGVGIAPGTTITAIGATTITMSLGASASPGLQQIGYTICGDFKTERPLRVTNSFTRYATQIAGLDYPIEVVSQERYIEIGYKGISAPWPIALWYNPTIPLGTLYFYQNPSAAGELHLFGDTVLRRFSSLTQRVVIPQGYVRWIKWELARELAPEYGAKWTQNMNTNLMEARSMVKALNQVPVPVARFDEALMSNGRRSPAAWILTGGFG